MIVASLRHALRSEWPYVIIVIMLLGTMHRLDQHGWPPEAVQSRVAGTHCP